MERTTVRLPEDLLDRARKKAAAEKTTLTALIERGLREVVMAKQGPQKRRKVILPVSKAKGGLMPGLDPVKFVQQIQELEDLEYIERMKRF
ncbi:MAG: hypothetical protein ABL957_04100 [Parvularculaceae bacterium]